MVKGRPELDRWKETDGRERVTKRIVANAVGAELRFATAEITRTPRTKARSAETAEDIEGSDLDEDF